ncbi:MULTISPECIES: hypothetical protein [unclassified Streptomyces]|uniref:hypothetical protein n=1 Tax=unclassified Streptomyces TaxID=2593676 RepID=UPI001EEFAB90|nr:MULTISPECIES: hypothetical protein [unclassified Streptomyces]
MEHPHPFGLDGGSQDKGSHLVAGRAAPRAIEGKNVRDVEVYCSRCGSADTEVKDCLCTVKHGRCLRCDKGFQAAPCPNCGSYRVEGSDGVSGSRFAVLPATVSCMNCHSAIPARDPGLEGTGER